MHSGTEPLRLAIIGGGVSGLSSAYYLLQNARLGDRPLHIDIYERKALFGGNADTVLVDLGDYIDCNGDSYAYLRWGDLGVNDVNLTTYVELRAIMKQIGYLGNMLPLQDSTSYFNRSGTLALTDDSGLRDGVTSADFNLRSVDKGLLVQLIGVVHTAAVDMLDKISPEYTVGTFFNACVAQPAQMLAKAANKLGIKIDWEDPHLKSRMTRVRDDIYYPRIAAMYFTDERGPWTLPLQSPFQYYNLQEGKPDGPPAQRCYFEHGAQKWLEALADYLVAQSNDQVSVALHTEADVRAHVRCGRVSIQGHGIDPAEYDLCVLATHADDTLKLLNFDSDMGEWNRMIRATLSQVSYTRGFAVCHTWTGEMPQNENIWRTYNVLQREPTEASFPYRMSYVENRHQNDPVNPQYSRAGLPLYFISLVKSLDEIPESAMLDRVKLLDRVDPALLAALPRATQRQVRGESLRTGYRMPGEAHPRLSNKAWTVFKHNVLNAECIHAQNAMERYNQGIGEQIRLGHQPSCALFFGGGWTNGAGLQEQCILQSQKIAGWIGLALHPHASSPVPAPLPSEAATTA